MSDKIARMEEELALLKAEAAFVEKKQAGGLTSENKQALRELRQTYRENIRTPIQDGAQPDSIGTTGKAEF